MLNGLKSEYIVMRTQTLYRIRVVGSMVNHMEYVKLEVCNQNKISKVNMKMNMTLPHLMFVKTFGCLH